jgi:hypothetical protein
MPTPKQPDDGAGSEPASRAIEIAARILERQPQEQPAFLAAMADKSKARWLLQLASALVLLEEMQEQMREPIELPGAIELPEAFRASMAARAEAIELVFDLLADAAEWGLSLEP